MLRSLRLKNFRCFEDTDDIGLSQLNVFLGPNNAGKSSLLSAMELLLRTQANSFPGSPMPVGFEDQPEYASFPSILRKAWGPKEAKPTSFSVESEWSRDSTNGLDAWCRLVFKGDPLDDTTYVHSADYGLVKSSRRGDASVRLRATKKGRARRYEAQIKGRKHPAYFIGLFPFLAGGPESTDLSPEQSQLLRLGAHHRYPRQLTVIRPHRPVPRRLYVLDDPALSVDDRDLLGDLVGIWSGGGRKADERQERIREALEILNLAKHIEVTRPRTSGGGSSVVQVRVSTGTKRELVTIADVGFGLSQVLPLVARDATLDDGVLIAYQPEVHLHPYAQSRLADLFVRSLERNNMIFVETHSEYLILRLQQLIAGGYIDPELVRVFLVESQGKRSTVSTMDFDEKGSPSRAWPRGFLDTGLELARGLVRARQGSDG